MIAELERRLGEVEVGQKALEVGQRQLRISVHAEIAELTIEVNEIGKRMAEHLGAIMSEWQALAGRMTKLVREHGEFHKPPNGEDESNDQ